MVYSFDYEKVFGLPLKQTKRCGDEQLKEDTSIGKLLEELKGKDFQIEDILTVVSVITDGGSFELRGPTFHLKVAVAILELQKEGIKPLASEWFWFDTDASGTNPTISYSFFVVHRDRIVREAISFLDYPESGFDPVVFDAGDDSSGSDWHRWFITPSSNSSWEIARAAY